ncbi:MAG TPA: hypothetical protein VGM88_10960 [Kofleriaceae bacterium]|jgi:hypothetical protein
MGGGKVGEKLPRDERALASIALPLTTLPVWGDVAIRFVDLRLVGLRTLAADAPDARGDVALHVPGLALAGTIALAADAPGTRPRSAGALGPALAALGTIDDGHLALARRFRARLVELGGADWSAIYDEHDAALNELLTGQDVVSKRFQTAFATFRTDGQTSAYYAARTATAGDHPADPAHAVNDDAYRAHTLMVVTNLVAAAMARAATHDDRDPFWRLQARVTASIDQGAPFVHPMTADAVVTTAAATRPAAPSYAERAPPVLPPDAAPPAELRPTVLRPFRAPIALARCVARAGERGRIARIDARAHSIEPALAADDDALVAAAAPALAAAAWIHALLARRAEATLARLCSLLARALAAPEVR